MCGAVATLLSLIQCTCKQYDSSGLGSFSPGIFYVGGGKQAEPLKKGHFSMWPYQKTGHPC